MKNKFKIGFLAFAMFIAVAAFAQSAVFPLFSDTASGGKELDTITNAGTVLMTTKFIAAPAQTTTIQAVYTKLTGTVAGTATVWGSINGVNYVQADTTSKTITNVVTQTFAWRIPYKPFTYWQLRTVGSGTSTYTVKGGTLVVTP